MPNFRARPLSDRWFAEWKALERPSASQLESVERNLVMHLKPLRGLLVEQITPDLFRKTIAEIAEKRPRTAQHAYATGRRLLLHAKTSGQRVDEKVFDVKRPKCDERDPVFLTWPQVQELAACSTEPHLIEFAALTGLRRGELAALRDTDVDAQQGVVRISRSGYRGEVVQRTKTKTSVRSVSLSEAARKVLLEQLLARPQGSSYVFPAENGLQWDKRSMLRRFARARRRYGRTDMDFHDLRHTYVSLMAAAGVMPQQVADLVGHNDGGVLVMKRYGHLFPTAQAQAVNALDAFLTSDVSSVRDEEAAV